MTSGPQRQLPVTYTSARCTLVTAEHAPVPGVSPRYLSPPAGRGYQIISPQLPHLSRVVGDGCGRHRARRWPTARTARALRHAASRKSAAERTASRNNTIRSATSMALR